MPTSDQSDPFEIPDFLRIPRDQRAEAWKGRRLTRTPKILTESKVINDPGTIALLAEIKRREQAEEAERARAREESRIIGQKKRTRTLAMKRALAETNQQLSTDGDDDMAKKSKTAKKPRGKQVTPRFKTKAGKKPEALKKPRPERAPRNAHVMADKPVHLSKKAASALVASAPDAIKPTAKAEAKPPKAESKGAKLEGMLRKAPVSAAEIAEQLGWLPHTTRAAISRVGFDVTTEKKDGVTLYHIAANASAKVAAAKAEG